MHDPDRVSHSPVRQSVRHPSGVAGIEPHRNPESSGLRPSTSGLKNGHPCRGASLPYRTGRTGQTGRTAQETPGIRQGSPARLTIPSTNPAVIITSYPAVSRDEVPKAAEYSRDALYKRRSLLCDLIPSNAPPESLQVTLFFGDPQGGEGLGFAAIHRSPVCG